MPETLRKDGGKTEYYPFHSHIHTRSLYHQSSRSCDRGRGANSAWLFTLLISGVVTTIGTHRLTSALAHTRKQMQETLPWANEKTNKKSSEN